MIVDDEHAAADVSMVAQSARARLMDFPDFAGNSGKGLTAFAGGRRIFERHEQRNSDPATPQRTAADVRDHRCSRRVPPPEA
jgi:hypothetical protein